MSAKVFPLVALAVLGLAGCQNQTANVEGCRVASEAWVRDTLPDGYRMAKFTSATLDTDEDGYVTADVLVTRDGKTFKLIQLGCPTMGDPTAIQKGGSAKLEQIPYNNTFEAQTEAPAQNASSAQR